MGPHRDVELKVWYFGTEPVVSLIAGFSLNEIFSDFFETAPQLRKSVPKIFALSRLGSYV
jgi:hypothetical protein